MATTRARRPTATRAKVTITVPKDLLAAAHEKIKAGRCSSLSAYISEALADKVAQDSGRDGYIEWLNQLKEELGPPSEEDYEWARKALRR